MSTRTNLTLRLLEEATHAPITLHKGFVCVDLDTFVMDNSNTWKEEVGRTYQGVDGCAPFAAYIRNEGWNIGLELRAGTQHSACETDYFLERVFPWVQRLCCRGESVLWQDDGGFDSVRLLFMKAQEKERWADKGQRFDYLTKWNPRKQNKNDWVYKAEAAGVFEEQRPGKRGALMKMTVPRAWQGSQRNFVLHVRVIERTINEKGQHLLVLEIELEGWWSSLDLPMAEVIELYKHHVTHEQFHSEFESDLDLERLPLGKFDTNDGIVHLASFAYNCLRLLGQLGLTREISPIWHPAKRRRLKTVFQEIMYRAARMIEHARKIALDFGRGVALHTNLFMELQILLKKAVSYG